MEQPEEKLGLLTMHVLQSLEELQRHDASCTPAETSSSTWFEVRSAYLDQVAHVHIWWRGTKSRLSDDFLWDKFATSIDSKESLVEALKACPVELQGKKVVYSSLATSALGSPRQAPPLFNYHPQRVRAMLPFAKSVSSLGVNGGSAAEVGYVTRQEMRQLSDVIGRAVVGNRENINEASIRSRIKAEKADPRVHTTALAAYTHFMWFERAGRNIFDIPALLTEMFRQTDIDDVPASFLKFPHSSFYLAFGPQQDIQLREGWCADGAYVTLSPHGTLAICVTAQPPSVDAFANCCSLEEPFYIQKISAEHMKLSLAEATTASLAETLAELRTEVADQEFPRMVQQVNEEIGGESSVTLASSRERNARAQLERLPGKHAMYEKMLRLIVNAIIYLTAYPDDVRKDWPAETPQRLRDQATQTEGSYKQARNAVSKLLALGYTSIHFCGKNLDDELSPYDSSVYEARTEDVDTVVTWVRGFWMRQAHGQGRTLRRWQWRMPTKRHYRRTSDNPAVPDEHGHIYMVS